MTENLEIGNADLFYTGLKVKYSHVKEHFHTGSLIVCTVDLGTAQLELEGKVGFLERTGYEVEWGMWHFEYWFLPKDEPAFPVDIDSTIFTLKTPVPFTKF